ncbi:MAG: hypothetical protein JO192_02685 [Candidatus Eremiobacteraeota bacterium]|nr:hypothetical protein [Candidatus Eremiobacteraeota bacterium]
MTRADARDFLAVAARENVRARTTVFGLREVQPALDAVRSDAVDGAAVVRCSLD